MMLRVLDTDHLSLFQRGYAALLPRIQAVPATWIAISIVSVTRNRRDFGRIAELVLEDWTIE